MRVISFIEDGQVIRAILEHLGLWLARARPPPKIHAPPEIEYPVDVFLSHTSADTHLHGQAQDEIYGDPEYNGR